LAKAGAGGINRAGFPFMTVAIILGLKHGSSAVKVVSGPGDPRTVNEKFNKLTLGDGEGYAEIYLHELMLSNGRKQKRFPKR
jgi:hypothetical protein